jgi:hypothetical protein
MLWFTDEDHFAQKPAICWRAALVGTLVMLGSLVASVPTPAGAGGMGGGGGAVAAAVGSAGLGACNSNSGKALYDCVANVFDRMSNEYSRGNPEARRALSTAASQLRAAVSKVQALSAISQCRAVIAGVLRQVTSSGADGSGLGAIAGVLARAAQLIQSKG